MRFGSDIVFFVMTLLVRVICLRMNIPNRFLKCYYFNMCCAPFASGMPTSATSSSEPELPFSIVFYWMLSKCCSPYS